MALSERYVAYMRKPKQFGDELMLCAVAAVYNRPIHLLTATMDMQKFLPSSTKEAGEAIHLVFRRM